MRGWRYIGIVDEGYRCDRDMHVPLRNDGEGIVADAGDIIAVSPYPDGPLRDGSLRVVAVNQGARWMSTPGRWCIPGMCSGDYVFVATAIGADIFKRVS